MSQLYIKNLHSNKNNCVNSLDSYQFFQIKQEFTPTEFGHNFDSLSPKSIIEIPLLFKTKHLFLNQLLASRRRA